MRDNTPGQPEEGSGGGSDDTLLPYHGKNRLGELLSSKPSRDGRRALRYFSLSDEELSLLPAARLLEAHHQWCRTHFKVDKPKQLRMDRTGQYIYSDAMLEHDFDFHNNLKKLRKNLPPESPLQLARPPIPVAAYETRANQVILFELINREGNYLTFDGNSLEVTDGGPAFVQVQTMPNPDLGGVPYTLFYSHEAFEERLRTVIEPYTIGIEETFKTKDVSTFMHLLNVAVTNAYNEAEVDYSPSDEQDLIYSGAEFHHPESPHFFDTDSGSVSVKFSLSKHGVPEIDVTVLEE